VQRSQFNLFYDIGVRLFGSRSRQAFEFAMNRMAPSEPTLPRQIDPQLFLDLETRDWAHEKNCSRLDFLATPSLGNAKKVFSVAILQSV
jgi:hypothetical protein